MTEVYLISGRDMVLFASPFVLLLVICVFGFHQRLSQPKKPLSRRRHFFDVDMRGEPILRDPDGRLSERHRGGQ
jgi:hypothetical protein